MNREKAFVDVWDLVIIPSINSTFDEMAPQFIAQTNAECRLMRPGFLIQRLSGGLFFRNDRKYILSY